MSFCCVFVLLPWILLCLKWWSLTLLSLSPVPWRGTSALIASSLSVSLFSDFRQHKSSILLCEPQIENLICISPFAFITTVCGLLSSNDIYNLYYFIIYIFYICCFFFCMMCFLSFYFWKSLVFGKLGSLAWVHFSTLVPLVPHPWASLVSLLIFHSGLQGRFSDTYFLPGQQSMSCFHPSTSPFYSLLPISQLDYFCCVRHRVFMGLQLMTSHACVGPPVKCSLSSSPLGTCLQVRVRGTEFSELCKAKCFLYRKPSLAGYESLGHTFYSE